MIGIQKSAALGLKEKAVYMNAAKIVAQSPERDYDYGSFMQKYVQRAVNASQENINNAKRAKAAQFGVRVFPGAGGRRTRRKSAKRSKRAKRSTRRH